MENTQLKNQKHHNYFYEVIPLCSQTCKHINKTRCKDGEARY